MADETENSESQDDGAPVNETQGAGDEEFYPSDAVNQRIYKNSDPSSPAGRRWLVDREFISKAPDDTLGFKSREDARASVAESERRYNKGRKDADRSLWD